MILDWIGSVLDPDQESSPADDAGEFAPHSLEEHGSMSSLSDGSMSQRQPLNPPSHWQGERPSVLPRYHPNPSHRRIMNTHRIQHHSDSSLIMHTDAVRTRARAFRLGRRRISKLPRGLRRGTLDSIKNVDVFQPSTPAKVIKTPRGPGELQPLLEASGSHLDSTVASSRGQQLDTSHHSQAPSAPYPIGPVVLVFIDGISDGLTMGITETLGVTQGIILGISLAVEMAFTGAALAAILSDRGTRRTTSLITLTVVPFSMLIGGILGRFLMMEVDEASPVFAGFMSFVVGQLFYLATVELIGEGHAIVNDLGKAAFSRWFDVALLFGFMGELMVEIFLD
ncbi:uncharacterized protein MONBRDRAFT_22027 [Monosiga brevicollis MX1]|uniref:Uncharacterized protein n=1 Tax=Monosiga brevicollis TaxID=81824 RepID=A9UPB8_MONBE|nr:uncharacterized protein MONBRDRAFT_22027 [Monosiga brevicollis MX1]EDQ92849.1 predicted protein [Monosiga brevicollis MX1]|eukprot:XP_001742611.1 hypothetical protein [Monosiga brevicollis MX1]